MSAPSKEALPPVLYSLPSTEETSRALASFILAAQNAALAKNPYFKIALSGGSLPKVLTQLANTDIQWDKWQVFFADERAVALDSEDSNYHANNIHLFSHVPIPKENIHTISTDLLDDPDALAEEYEQQMISVFLQGSNTIAFPRFDLILLGIGPDGHTCSLFPGHPLLEERDSWVASISDSPKPPPVRITLTFPVLNHAIRVAFVATGASKQDILHRVLDLPEEGLPCSLVKVVQPGRVYYFTDTDATAQVQFQKTEFNFDSLKL